MTHQPPFFIAGAALRANTPSYVARPADQELLDGVREGAFCYVLTARQMGKSSLMVQAASRLREQDFKSALIDLSHIRATAKEDWYLELLGELKRQLGLTTDVQAWWVNRNRISALQRFFVFLRDIVLTEAPGKIVLFVDEIDTMLKLDFRDDFFAAIRATYNARAQNPAFERLTFVLLGVATPLDLIKDAKRTPFNIGRRIELREFDYADAAPLRRGLEARYPGQSDRILRRIFHWTGGHPYLTQKLCLAVAEATASLWEDAQVDRLVEAQFFSTSGKRDPNLEFVRTSIAATPPEERQAMLQIYDRVYRGEAVADDESSQAQNHLELFGLVRVERGQLQIRNAIYRHVFDKRWIETILPQKRRDLLFPLFIALVAIAILTSSYAVAQWINFANGGRPTASAVADTAITGATSPVALVDTQTPTPSATPPIETAAPSDTPEPIPTDTSEPVPTDTPTPEPPTNTPEPVPTDTPEPPPTDTPEPPTPIIVSCTVVNSGGVTVRTGPDINAPSNGSLAGGADFSPVAKSTNDARFVWVRVPSPAGWVYAGTSGTQLVSCTNLENIPIQ